MVEERTDRSIVAVSYTHLDVYKRQRVFHLKLKKLMDFLVKETVFGSGMYLSLIHIYILFYYLEINVRVINKSNIFCKYSGTIFSVFTQLGPSS